MDTRFRRNAAVVAAVVFGLGAWFAAGPGHAADPPQDERVEAFEYVGLQYTIARVNVRTGKIDILTRGGETRVSLVTPGSRPWSWRPIPVKPTESTLRRPWEVEDPEERDRKLRAASD